MKSGMKSGMRSGMKIGMKWGAVLASAGLLTVGLYTSAGAAQVGTIDNGYPGDTEAQAQMLHDLGLFQGTDEGFQLDKPMTRAQAAVMLVRLLGEEQTALSAKNTHPFTDVPPWADAYIGWLYQNGLTKGTSATTYGSSRRITCHQYSTFLTRASRNDEVYLVIPDDEIDACDSVGFTRGDAVSLSTRLLGMFYEKDENADGVSVAQRLREKGVFTVEQLKAAAWDVLPRQYENANARRSTLLADGDWTISCMLAGVPVLRGEQANLSFLPEQELTRQVYCCSNQDDVYTLYRVDRDTLATTELVHYPTDRSVDVIGNAGDTDYLLVRNYDDDTSILLAVTDTEAKPLEGITWGFQPVYHSTASGNAKDANHWMAFDVAEGIAVLDATGSHVLDRPTENSQLCAIVDDHLILQDVAPDATILIQLNRDGTSQDRFKVPNRADESDASNGQQPDGTASGLSITRSKGSLFGGTAGLYCLDSENLSPTGAITIRQLSLYGVYDWEIDPSDNSIVAILSDQATILRITPGSRPQMLLSNTPDHGLHFSEISYANQGEVRAVYSFIMGMADEWAYEYAIEDGRPRPLVHEMGNGYSGYSEEECAKEQARLNAIYAADIDTNIDADTNADTDDDES